MRTERGMKDRSIPQKVLKMSRCLFWENGFSRNCIWGWKHLGGWSLGPVIEFIIFSTLAVNQTILSSSKKAINDSNYQSIGWWQKCRKSVQLPTWMLFASQDDTREWTVYWRSIYGRWSSWNPPGRCRPIDGPVSASHNGMKWENLLVHGASDGTTGFPQWCAPLSSIGTPITNTI